MIVIMGVRRDVILLRLELLLLKLLRRRALEAVEVTEVIELLNVGAVNNTCLNELDCEFLHYDFFILFGFNV